MSRPQGFHTWLVEHYQPGMTAAELHGLANRIHAAATEMSRNGRGVRYQRSTIIPGDECLLCTIEARSEDLVRELYEQADLGFDRISEVVPVRSRQHGDPRPRAPTQPPRAPSTSALPTDAPRRPPGAGRRDQQ